MFRLDYSFTVNNDFVTLDGNNFTGIFVYKILNPCFQHTCGQLTSHHLLEVRLVHLHVFRQIKNLENVLVILKSDGSQQSGNRQFLLTVNVRIHDVVDVGGKLNPRTTVRMIGRLSTTWYRWHVRSVRRIRPVNGEAGIQPHVPHR